MFAVGSQYSVAVGSQYSVAVGSQYSVAVGSQYREMGVSRGVPESFGR